MKIVTIIVPSSTAPAALDGIRDIARRHPGEAKVKLAVGRRELTLGDDCRVDPTPGCLTALAEWGRIA